MFEPKREKTGGRKKGVANKTTKAVKEMILAALDEVGGQEYFVTQATENPVAFMTLIGKVLPSEIKGELTHAGEIRITKIDRVIVNSQD